RHFNPGETGPVTVLLASSTDWNTEEGRRVLAHLSHGFAMLPNVAEVRSLIQPLGTPVPPLPALRPSTGNSILGQLVKSVGLKGEEVRHQADKVACQYYLATVAAPEGQQHVTRMDVVLHSDPFGSESRPTLELIETWLRDE